MAGLLCALSALLTACAAGKSDGARDNVAILDMPKAIKAHVLYPAWQGALNSQAATQKLKENHIKLAQSQALFINKMQQLGETGHSTFLQADYTVRMSEARLKERETLEQQRRQEKERIDTGLQGKIAAVEEEYRLPIFNLKVRIESINPVRRSREEFKAEKEKMIVEMTKLQEEKAKKLEAIYQEGDILLAKAMQSYEDAANQRLAEYAKTLHRELAEAGQMRQKTSDERLASIPETFSKSIASIDKQLVEQKLLADKLEARIMDDVKSQAARVAVAKKYTIVLSEIKMNIKAADITDEVIAGLPTKIDENIK